MKRALARRLAIYQLLRKSPAARALAERREEINVALDARPRKIWPVAAVARFFGISPRLLWNWIGQNLITEARPPAKWGRAAGGKPVAGMMKGLSPGSIRSFLEILVKQHRCSLPQPAVRKSPAAQRCLEHLKTLRTEQCPTPLEFAAGAGVSAATVRRLIRQRRLPSWRISKGRVRIGKKPAQRRKVL